MASNETYETLALRASNYQYSMTDAIKFLKVLDKFPTSTNVKINWIDSETKKSVVIGYNNKL